jgi:outer membrane lipoprotein carrier protein
MNTGLSSMVYFALRLIFLSITAAVLSYGAALAEPPPLDKLIAKIQGIYEVTEDLQTDFIHIVPVPLTGKILTEEGIFYFKKPERMLWEYRKPPLKKLVINPETTWFYLPEDNRVYIHKTKDIINSQIAVSFFAGMGELEEKFDIVYSKPNPTDSEGNYLISLRPKQYEEGIQELELKISKESYYVIGYNLIDLYGNVNRYTFDNIRINNKLPDTLFRFVPPPGVEIQEIP